MDRISFREAMVKLAERAGIPTRSALCPTQSRIGTSLPGARLGRANFCKVSADKSRRRRSAEYLKERGLKPITIEKHRIGFAPDAFDWLISAGNKQGFSDQVLLKAGLV